MRFTVIGAGNGGRAFTAYLSSMGHSINLYNRSYNRVHHIIKKGGIKSKGLIKGFHPVKKVTLSLGEAVKNADVILIVTPASAHKNLAQKIAPFLAKDQIILLNPGRTFGAIEFSKTVEKKIGSFPIFVAETQTLLFTSRQLKKHMVQILKIKDEVSFAAYPDKDTFFIYDTLREIFPQLKPAEDYLNMTIKNIGMLLHPTLSLLNSGMMDIGKEFKFYKEGATRRTCKVLEHIQFEINQICEKLDIKRYNFCKWAGMCYGIKANSIYNSIQNIEAYKDISAPKELITRYFTEDVPTGLVPISSLAEFLDLKTPIINSIINLSSILCGINFKETGRTIKNLEIENYITSRTGVVLTSEVLTSEEQEVNA